MPDSPSSFAYETVRPQARARHINEPETQVESDTNPGASPDGGIQREYEQVAERSASREIHSQTPAHGTESADWNVTSEVDSQRHDFASQQSAPDTLYSNDPTVQLQLTSMVSRLIS